MNKEINLESNGSKFNNFLVKPGGSIKGGLIVIHEVWGLNEHTKNVAKRFADEGYVVLAPDLLSDVGLSPDVTGKLQLDLFDPQKRNEVQPKLRELMAPMQSPEFAVNTIKKLKVCFDFLYKMSEVDKKVAVLGFCFGGSYSFSLAINEPRLLASIPYYGHCDAEVEELKKITCPVLAFYGEKDERLINALPELEENMKLANVDFAHVVYKDCGHAFFNDTNHFAYNREAAEDSFSRSIDLLDKVMS